MYNLENIEKAYYRFQALANNLHYRLREYEDKEKNKQWDVIANSRIIISNLKDKTDADKIVLQLNSANEEFLNKEYKKFKEAV